VITVPAVFTVEIMLSIIIPTEGIEGPAVATLAALVPGAATGVVREVLLIDRANNGVIERVAGFLPSKGRAQRRSRQAHARRAHPG
jgi:hypothetical protein